MTGGHENITLYIRVNFNLRQYNLSYR